MSTTDKNEIVIEKILAARREVRQLTKEELSSEFPQLGMLFDERGFFRTRPDLHGMDGFFAVVLTNVG